VTESAFPSWRFLRCSMSSGRVGAAAILVVEGIAEGPLTPGVSSTGVATLTFTAIPVTLADAGEGVAEAEADLGRDRDAVETVKPSVNCGWVGALVP
jgi:hypothetical protein